MKHNTLTKIITLALAVVLALSLAALLEYVFS